MTFQNSYPLGKRSQVTKFGHFNCSNTPVCGITRDKICRRTSGKGSGREREGSEFPAPQHLEKRTWWCPPSTLAEEALRMKFMSSSPHKSSTTLGIGNAHVERCTRLSVWLSSRATFQRGNTTNQFSMKSTTLIWKIVPTNAWSSPASSMVTVGMRTFQFLTGMSTNVANCAWKFQPKIVAKLAKSRKVPF